MKDSKIEWTDLFSDIDDVDSAYMKITGMTKAERDREIELEIEKNRKNRSEHKKAIPEWIFWERKYKHHG